jgi:hypothetical protein
MAPFLRSEYAILLGFSGQALLQDTSMTNEGYALLRDWAFTFVK